MAEATTTGGTVLGPRFFLAVRGGFQRSLDDLLGDAGGRDERHGGIVGQLLSAGAEEEEEEAIVNK